MVIETNDIIPFKEPGTTTAVGAGVHALPHNWGPKSKKHVVVPAGISTDHRTHRGDYLAHHRGECVLPSKRGGRSNEVPSTMEEDVSSWPLDPR